jgi:L-lysine exporter family protein LysE/ArgO
MGWLEVSSLRYATQMEVLLKGMAISGGLIVAIGSQNVFVMKQGLMNRHIFMVAFTCFLCDVLLMSAGIMGLGSIIKSSKIATLILALSGGLFLLYYSARAFMGAIKGSQTLEANNTKNDFKSDSKGFKSTLFATLAVTLINPHVYLDTVVVVGGIAGTLPFNQKLEFLAGAALASGIWFFALGYGARNLAPLFRKPMTWRILETVIGVVMLVIAYSLLEFCYTTAFKQ